MASLEKSITFYGDNDTKFTYNMNDTNMVLINHKAPYWNDHFVVSVNNIKIFDSLDNADFIDKVVTIGKYIKLDDNYHIYLDKLCMDIEYVNNNYNIKCIEFVFDKIERIDRFPNECSEIDKTELSTIQLITQLF